MILDQGTDHVQAYLAIYQKNISVKILYVLIRLHITFAGTIYVDMTAQF
jgi:hypothetical protein